VSELSSAKDDALPMSDLPITRSESIRHARLLEIFTVSWNAVEALIGIVAGLAAGSVALVGFALDSVAESASGGVLLWRLRAEGRGTHTSEEVERTAVRGVALAFFALALYVGGRSIFALVTRDRPETSVVGLALAVVSLVVMPILARKKRRAAADLDSRSLDADASQTNLCTYLSAIVLAGLFLNAALGWWWADPVAALGIAVLAAREGVELWRTEDLCCP
jgi:divalent metal cation (Fe/Co/Zn/Cd) transporter